MILRGSYNGRMDLSGGATAFSMDLEVRQDQTNMGDDQARIRGGRIGERGKARRQEEDLQSPHIYNRSEHHTAHKSYDYIRDSSRPLLHSPHKP